MELFDSCAPTTWYGALYLPEYGTIGTRVPGHRWTWSVGIGLVLKWLDA